MFYSKSTGGFYDPAIHGSNIPADAVEITEAEHAALMYGQSSGKRIIHGDDGRPTLGDHQAPSKKQRMSAAMEEYRSDIKELNESWLAASVSDGQGEAALKASIVQQIAERDSKFKADIAAIKAS